MTAVCFYFQVHQPERLREYGVFDIGNNDDYWDHRKNEQVMKKVARKCYLPANQAILNQIRKHNGKFKVAYSITGTAIEQFEKYAPEVLESFKELADTGCVEFLSETYYHSLSYIFSKDEFKDQVNRHKELVKKHFGQEPRVFRNTELIFNNELAKYIEDLGFEGVVAEGADHILGWRSPNFVYSPVTTDSIKLMLKNYKLSDDIAFRFSNKGWKEYPLTTEKFATWLAEAPGDTINLFMDYETFGEHHWEDTGILKFLEKLPEEILKRDHLHFRTPSELLEFEPRGDLDIHSFVSWADLERDLSAWMGNSIQDSALAELYRVEKAVKESGDEKLKEDWRKLTTSDHFYYMCIKWFEDGDVHKYFNPYDSPYEAYISFMNVLNDMTLRIKNAQEPKIKISETPSAVLQ